MFVILLRQIRKKHLRKRRLNLNENVAIIGAGLAGTAIAFVLRQYGLSPVIYELSPNIAPGASGNALGLYAPRISAERTPESEYYSAAFGALLRMLSAHHIDGGFDWQRCGALYLTVNEKKKIRFSKTLKNWGWTDEHMQLLTPNQASKVAGIGLRYGALYLPDAGCVSPKKLCEYYARGTEIKFGTFVENLADLKNGIVILACGMGVLGFQEASYLPLKAVRGQITEIQKTPALSGLKTNLCYGGYCTPYINEAHMVGATFQRWLDHAMSMKADNVQNIDKLSTVLSQPLHEPQVVSDRAAVRTTSPDHFPVVGRIPGYQNVYVSTAHGSHGIVSSLMAAHVLADMILNQPSSLPNQTLKKLSPNRFQRDI